MNSVPGAKRSGFRRLRTWLLSILALLIAGIAFLLVYNNFSLRSQSRAEFDAQLDRELDKAIDWILRDPRVSQQNPTVMYMVADMESMSHDPRLTKFLDDYRQSIFLLLPRSSIDFTWSRLVNPRAPVPVVTARELEHRSFELRWDAYAIAPDKIQLSREDRADMFSATKYVWGMRQHQLLALVMYRHFNGSTPELDQTMNYLSEKIARDAHYDFRVSDSYIQRTTFVLAAGRPDLIRSRWVERIMANQNADGSWSYCWYGWCRGVLEFNVYNPGHATVQAAWALTMLKYRYPQWVEEHFK